MTGGNYGLRPRPIGRVLISEELPGYLIVSPRFFPKKRVPIVTPMLVFVKRSGEAPACVRG
jgi:hypothetical protein